MKNKLFKTFLGENDLKQYEAAKLLGISETSLCRKLREELPDEEQEKMINKMQEALLAVTNYRRIKSLSKHQMAKFILYLLKQWDDERAYDRIIAQQAYDDNCNSTGKSDLECVEEWLSMKAEEFDYE